MLDGQLDLFSVIDSTEFTNVVNSTNKDRKTEDINGNKPMKPIPIETDTESSNISQKFLIAQLPVEDNQTNVTSLPNLQKEEKSIELRHYPSVQKGERVKVGKPVDDNPESEGYISSYKGKKGIVFDMKEVRNPVHNQYRYNVWVLFDEKKEVGVFYDLELVRLEDKM